MIIGTPKEVKENETRVAMNPIWAKRLVDAGHEVWIQESAGKNSGFSDEDYIAAGAKVAGTAEEIYAKAEFITKVKELQPQEFGLIREDQMIMTWFHLAEDYDKPMAQALVDQKSIGLSMELIVLDDGSRPTMKPMSDIAGSMAMLESVKYCQTVNGGTGLLLRKVYGLPTPRIVVLGGGYAGFNAAQVAVGLGLQVTIIEASWNRIDYLKAAIPEADVVLYEAHALEKLLTDCDVFINCIYPSPEPGKREPLVTRATVKKMKKCSLIMDIAGAEIVETSHYTTLGEPTFTEEGILHYCVPNMPSLCPKTATEALLMITGPYILNIANKGLKQAATDDPAIRRCISTLKGQIVHPEIGINQEMPYVEFDLSMLD
ncbi:alanine dehydrogenase [Anaerovorax odorimutans]|uniref:alanine dehydrogenase n=1 Tax=Anaerovorax odorimutans TaxID=109327 RepID=A0ABT1RLQ0_9FIRM|nr:alanine dehydrogenase [Anaerovorax odorimutans]MCQ4636114.1 alanine dehydrogenase [Anaerovorax odorimutans]